MQDAWESCHPLRPDSGRFCERHQVIVPKQSPPRTAPAELRRPSARDARIHRASWSPRPTPNRGPWPGTPVPANRVWRSIPQFLPFGHAGFFRHNSVISVVVPVSAPRDYPDGRPTLGPRWARMETFTRFPDSGNPWQSPGGLRGIRLSSPSAS